MKGFEIKYKNEITKVAVEDGLITINIFTINGNKNDNRIYIGGVDNKKQERIIWSDFNHLSEDDSLQIEVSGIVNISKPIKREKDSNINNPLSKLQIFRELKDRLQKEEIL